MRLLQPEGVRLLEGALIKRRELPGIQMGALDYFRRGWKRTTLLQERIRGDGFLRHLMMGIIFINLPKLIRACQWRANAWSQGILA
jgi:hypothetical protein